MTVPDLPPGFRFDDRDTVEREADHFRRGFPFRVRGDWDEFNSPTNEEFERVCAGLAQLIATSTVRKLDLLEVTGEQLARVLAAPGAEALTGLAVMHAGYTPADGDEVLRALVQARPTAGLSTLHVQGYASAAGFAALAAAKFDRLTHLAVPMLSGRARDLVPLFGAKWFRALRGACVRNSDAPLERALVSAFAALPHLEWLELQGQDTGVCKVLGAPGGFPALTRLTVSAQFTDAAVARLVRAPFPRLAELSVRNLRNPIALPLFRAKWFPRLRVASFEGGYNKLTDKFALALSKSGAAAHLRVLELGLNAFGRSALAALGNGARFPNLTTLDLVSAVAPKMRAMDVARLLRGLSLPRLRHLNLAGWPLGDTGAKALAANPALATLTRLVLGSCRIGDKGLDALARSPHLQQLVELDLRYNKLKTAAALRATTRLPRLAALRLDGNAIPPAAHRKLHRVRGLVV
jgi:hypothetical protein